MSSPEAKAPAGAEPATGAVPPLRAAGTADAARPAPPTPPTPPTRATLGIAPPINPGCPTRLLVTGDPVAAVVPPGVMAAFPTARTCVCLAGFAGPPTAAPSIAGRERECQKGREETAR